MLSLIDDGPRRLGLDAVGRRRRYGHSVTRVASLHALSGSTEPPTTRDNTYSVQGIGQFDLQLLAGYAALRSGGAIVVEATPKLTGRSTTRVSRKIELHDHQCGSKCAHG
jgi:hypothetical protein